MPRDAPSALAPVRIAVRARPRAKKSRIIAVTSAGGLTVELALAAPPVDGSANEALVALLSEVLGVPKRALRLVVGASSRKKVVEVTGLAAEEIARRIETAAGA